MTGPVLSGKELSDVIAASRAVEGANMLPYTLSRAIERAVLAKRAEKQEPATYQYQDMDGKWSNFIDEQHRADTEKEGSWQIRALYSHPAPRDALREAALVVIERWGESSWQCNEQMAASVTALREALG